MTAPRVVVVEADGGARGNPGPAGWGAVVRDPTDGRVLAQAAEAIGVATNNVAEYQGLIAGLSMAADLGAAEVEVRMDSRLVVEQMAGRWRIRHPGLRPLAARAAELVERFDRVHFQWVPREQNQYADRLANEAMDRAAAPAGAPRPGRPGDDRAGGIPGKAGRLSAGSGDHGAAGEQTAGGGGWEPPVGTRTRLVLVRHPETALNAERRFSGRGDVPLTERGRQQIALIARRVAVMAPGVAVVATSPLSRCVEVAEAVAEACGGAPVVVEPDLVECDFGEWEGRTSAEVRSGWPEVHRAWQRSTAVAPPGGESFRRVARRVRRAVGELVRRHPDGTVVIVSHVTPLKLILRDALAASDRMLHRLFLDPGGISVVDRHSDGTVAVRTVNDTAHLAEPTSPAG